MAASCLDRSNLYMLPTRHGMLFAFVLLAMLLAAVNYANTLAYILTFLLFSITLLSMLYTHRNLDGLCVAVGRCDPAFSGQEIHFQVCLTNPHQRERFDIAIEVAGYDAPRQTIGPHATRCFACKTRALRRGWQSLPDIQVNTHYPLGIMFSWSKPLSLVKKALVYPAPQGSRELPFAGGESQPDVRRQSPGIDDFSGLRPFREGDPPQHVDWKSYARGKGMYSKEFVIGQLPELELRWEDTHGDTEARLGQLCTWVLEASSQGLQYRLSLPGKRIGPSTGPVHAEICLRELALF